MSFLSIGDGATKELKTILYRLKELSAQSSNGVYANRQRQSLQAEATAARDEYNRITATTRNNGVQIFGYQDLQVQAGINADSGSALNVILGEVTLQPIADGTFQAAVTLNVPNQNGLSSVKVVDMNGDSHPDIVTTSDNSAAVTVMQNNGNGTFGTTLAPAVSRPLENMVYDLNGDGKRDIMSVGLVGGLGVSLANSNGTFGPLLFN